MSGIVFFSTEQREAVVEFYTETVGAEVWLDQPDCTILDYDGFRFGFCQRETTDDCGILTFVSDDRAGVDEMHEAIERSEGEARAIEEPHENEKYDIYQFFAEDPDGRTAEFQTFLHDLPE
jgi:hypothetical protein